jgi:hypothetical protein
MRPERQTSNNESYKKNDVAKTPINNASKKQYQ